MSSLTAPDGTPPSRLCFGAMQFGGTADATAASEMYAACREAGVNFFDTAHAYTGGQSERMLGKLVASERDKIIVATKAAYEGGASRRSILASVEESRGRLGLDTIDLLYMHRWDAETPLEETFYTLAELIESRAIRKIGVSNYAAWQVMKAQAVAARVGLRVHALQPMYNLVKRQAEVELLPMAQDQDIAVMPYSPLGGGLLTGKYARGGGGRLTDDTRYAARYAPDWMHAAGRGLAEIAEEVGISAATLAVAWVMRHPGVTAPIVSARSAEQLGPSLAALDLSLEPDLAERITALSPTPAPATDRLEEA